MFETPEGFTTVGSWDGGRFEVAHRNGVPWFEAPLPHRFHRCKVQTQGWVDLDFIERCACGAVRLQRSGWWRKNETRKNRKRK